MLYVFSAIRLFFLIYSLMLLIRILGSWFPSFQKTKFMHFIAHYTEPYINLFRRFIPPIGGVIDLCPLIAFFVLNLLEKFLIWLLLRI